MAIQVPQDFMNLDSAAQREKSLCNVIGVVTDILPARSTRGLDWMFTFTIDDGTTCGLYNQGQKIRLFGKEKTFPPINGPGDAIMLRQVRCMTYSGQMLLVSTIDTSWVLFPGPIPRKMPDFGASLKHIKSKTALKPSQLEMEYIVFLASSLSTTKFSAPLSQEDKQKLNAPTKKFSLIKNVAVEGFYDLVGQVVKIFPDRERVDFYLTDYTEHFSLYNYKSQDEPTDGSNSLSNPKKPWQGPHGKYTILITAFPPHSYWITQNVNPGDFVHARNVRIRHNRNDDSRIEGVLHGEKKSPDRINVKILEARNDDRVQELLTRKRECGFSHVLEAREPDEDAPRGEKRKSTEELKQNTKLSRNQRRNQAQRQKKAQLKAQEHEQSRKDIRTSEAPTATSSNPQQPPLSTPQTALRQALTQPNTNIRCTGINFPERTVSEIIYPPSPGSQDPNRTTTSRTTVRIIDFKPRSLTDFARPVPTPPPSLPPSSPSNSDSDSDHSISSLALRHQPASPSPSSKPQFEWAFALLLEDATPLPPSQPTQSQTSSPPSSNEPKGHEAKRDRMIAYVTNADAEVLLRSRARDLHTDALALAKLRERMFLLWGDLEERKGREEGGKEEVVTRPFTCCIREYGVQKEEGVWERRFGVCETEILQGDEEEEEGRNGGAGGEGKEERRYRAPVAG